MASPAAALVTLRREIDATPHHPDAVEIKTALDVLTVAVAGLAPLAARMCDPKAREAISAEPHGTLSNLSDAILDLAWAVQCWRERPENEPAALAAATRADAAREAAL